MGKVTVFILLIACVVVSPTYARIWYVHPDSVLNSIQAALDACSDNDTILVGPGTYYENLSWPYKQGIDLVSEDGPHETTIDGDTVGRVIEMTSTADTTTKIQGFTIQNGHTSSIGGGIFCDYGAAPLISNNIITRNRAGSNGGGGISCTGSTVITGNVISNNVAYLITWWAVGGGIYCDGSPIITNNIIVGNTADYAGGIFCICTTPVISGNTIDDNSAFLGGGGIYCWSGTPMISHNMITDNTANYGGGICCAGASSPIIDSCTIVNNAFDGVSCIEESHPVIHHNNIFGNSGYGVHNIDDTALVHAEYNWWGDPSGPYHPDSNPNGLGDLVSDYVAFTPWLDNAVGVTEEGIVEIEPENSGATIISGPLRLPDGKKCRVFDITGRVVVPDRMRPGIYFLEVDGTITKKVVKIK